MGTDPVKVGRMASASTQLFDAKRYRVLSLN